MIEQASLVEKGEEAMLFWTTDDGRLEWLSGSVDGIRALVEFHPLPNLKHYRVSDGHVHGTPDAPKYWPNLGDIWPYAKKPSKKGAR